MEHKRRLQAYILIALVLITTVYAADDRTLYDIKGPYLNAVAESITPYPVEPGLDFTIQLRVYNDGSGAANEVSVDFLNGSAFFMTGKGEAFDKPVDICAGCSKDNLFYFTVLPDIKSGEYPIIFKIRQGTVTYDETVLVRVIGQPDVLYSVELLNDSISPDDSFDVKFTVKNVGTGIARNLRIVPTTTGFVMRGANMIFIDNLAPDSTTEKIAHLMVSDSIVPGPQKVDFTLTYKDEKSTNYAAEQSLGVKLINKVRLDISSFTIEPQPLVEDELATITVRIENLGEGKAENVQVTIDGESFEGQNKAFIGKLRTNEDSPAVFRLTPSKVGTKDMTIRATYDDDTGAHTISETVNVRIERKPTTTLLISAIIVVIVGSGMYFGYRLLRKK